MGVILQHERIDNRLVELDLLIKRDEEGRPRCPHCHVKGWKYGSKCGTQFYRCPRCSRQFSRRSEWLMTHCPHGHLRNLENVWIDRRGGKHCRICDRNRKRGIQRGGEAI